MRFFEQEKRKPFILNLFGSRLLPMLILCCVALGFGCQKKPLMVETVPPEPDVVLPEPRPAPELSRIDRWHTLVRQKRTALLQEKIAAVNEFFNSFQIAEDLYIWGQEDYWATLYETLRKGQGDCEDLALAKYFTLRELNVADERMRITYVRSLNNGKPHMVLVCRLRSPEKPLVLDTGSNDVRVVTERPDLIPVYSFNANGYWLARQKEEWRGERLGGVEKLSLWRDVLERMKIDGREFALRQRKVVSGPATAGREWEETARK
jgi:predicted transglutaminase-like cysteine proteinase